MLSLTRQRSGRLDKDLANTARQTARGYATQVRVLDEREAWVYAVVSIDPGVPVGPDRGEALASIVREAVHSASRHGCAATANG